VLAISAYLVAIFVPCTSQSSTSLTPASLTSTTLAHAFGSGAHALPSESESTASRVASHHSHSQGALHEPTHHAGHASEHEGVAALERVASQELKPTCLCGCSDRRSQVGGSTARLGSVVPGTVVARLIETQVTPAGEHVLPMNFDSQFEIDPIPI
jgi:hypothetical protein